MADKPSRYLIPSRRHQVEEVIQRSRFITAGSHAPTAKAAQAFIEEMRSQYPDATHHCWAFVVGPPGETTSIGMSDDGEPHGTAGRPMLTALLHAPVGEIVAVCIRYYGGTKLGTGGLSRAYAGGVKLLLDSLPTEERVHRTRVKVVVDYDSLDALQRLLPAVEAVVETQDFGERVEFSLAVPEESVGRLAQDVAGITKGRGVLTPLDK